MGVASFCLISLMALMPVAVQRYHDADTQSAMVNMATMVARDLEATSGTGAGTSVRFQFAIPASGSTVGPYTIYVDASGNASGTTPNSAAPNPTSLYRVSVYFTPPVSGFTPPLRTATAARIWVTFPAQADPSFGTDAQNYVDMFETTIYLNRN